MQGQPGLHETSFQKQKKRQCSKAFAVKLDPGPHVVVPGPGDPMYSSDLCRHSVYIYRHTNRISKKQMG